MPAAHYPNGRVPDGCPLTTRQFEVMWLACAGHRLDEIAAQLNVGARTVRSHACLAYRALGTNTLQGAVRVMREQRWYVDRPVPLPPEQRQPPGATGSPLQQEHPFLAAYLHHFDRWLASRQQDRRERHLMDVALYGAITNRPTDKENR